MAVRVLIFGSLAQELGAREVILDVASPCAGQDVNIALAARFPARAAFFRAARLAVNGSFANADQAIAPGDEVAVIELVGGG